LSIPCQRIGRAGLSLNAEKNGDITIAGSDVGNPACTTI